MAYLFQDDHNYDWLPELKMAEEERAVLSKIYSMSIANFLIEVAKHLL